jgi:hypothetical protein
VARYIFAYLSYWKDWNTGLNLHLDQVIGDIAWNWRTTDPLAEIVFFLIKIFVFLQLTEVRIPSSWYRQPLQEHNKETRMHVIWSGLSFYRLCMESTMETCPMGNVLSNRLSGNSTINVADCIASVYGISTTMLFIFTFLQKKADRAMQWSSVFSRRAPHFSVLTGINFCN